MSSRKRVMAQNTKRLKGQGHTSRSSVKVTDLFYQTCVCYCWISTRNLKMMLLLDFAVARLNRTSGKKTHGNHSNNNIDRRVTSSVNKYSEAGGKVCPVHYLIACHSPLCRQWGARVWFTVLQVLTCLLLVVACGSTAFAFPDADLFMTHAAAVQSIPSLFLLGKYTVKYYLNWCIKSFEIMKNLIYPFL